MVFIAFLPWLTFHIRRRERVRPAPFDADEKPSSSTNLDTARAMPTSATVAGLAGGHGWHVLAVGCDPAPGHSLPTLQDAKNGERSAKERRSSSVPTMVPFQRCSSVVITLGTVSPPQGGPEGGGWP